METGEPRAPLLAIYWLGFALLVLVAIGIALFWPELGAEVGAALGR